MLDLLKKIMTELKQASGQTYFLIDETSFFSGHIVDGLKQKFSKHTSTGAVYVAYAKEFDAGRFEEHFGMESLFSPERALIVHEAEALSKSDVDLILKGLPDKPKSCTLVFEATKRPKHALYKYCQAHHRVHEFKRPYENKMGGWIQWMSLRYQKTMDAEAQRLLLEKVGNDLNLTEKAIEKLSIYVGDRAYIEFQDVQEVLYSSRSYSVFEWTDAIGNKDIKKSLSTLYALLKEGESEVFLFTMMMRHLRNLWKAIEWQSEKSEAEVQRLLGIHPFFWNGFRSQRDRWNSSYFEKIWQKAKQCDQDLKSTNMPKDDLLFSFVHGVLADLI